MYSQLPWDKKPVLLSTDRFRLRWAWLARGRGHNVGGLSERAECGRGRLLSVPGSALVGRDELDDKSLTRCPRP